MRLRRTVRQPSDLVWLARIGWFIVRLPVHVERSHLGELLTRLAVAQRPAAPDQQSAVERIVRLRQPWLRLPWLRSRDTCYVRALTMYRFLDPGGRQARLQMAVEWFDKPGGVLRGHAWVSLDGQILELPPGADDHQRLQLVDLAAR